jgi:trehalose synthase-fused probable maltokinase
VSDGQALAADLQVLDEQTLLDFVERQRWYGSKALDAMHARVLDSAVLRTHAPLLVTGLVEMRFQPGTHDLYQLLLGLRPADDGWEGDVIAERDDWVVYDALADPVLARELVSMMRGGVTVSTSEGAVEFRDVGLARLGDVATPRPVGAEQSNSSVIFGDELILKAYRRVEPGINPELELLRFLTAQGFENIAALAGWYAYSGELIDATLGVLQAYIPDAHDGWQLALDELGRDPESFLARLRRLGEVTGDMHTALARDAGDPDFAPEDPSGEALALLTATVDEEIEAIFLDLPETEALEPIAGRGEEVRERLRQISHVGNFGRVIRTHGDYHLGQVLWNGSDWIVLDFEGEPARSLTERRRKRSPLRDVAGMLRSFAYVASASELTRGVPPPDGWEDRAREEFLAGYFEHVDPSIVPPGSEGRRKLLAVFELEKAVYELRYELNNRPDWLRIPVAGIVRLLGHELS